MSQAATPPSGTSNSPQDSGRDIQSYFRRIFSDYQDSVKADGLAEVHRRIAHEIGPQLNGLVLDIGSGGVSDYDSTSERTIVSVDYVLEFLSHSRERGVIKAAGDIKALPFKRNSADRIVIQQVIHHLTGKLYTENLSNVRRAVLESTRVMKSGGHVFIIDSMFPSWMEILERAVYATSVFVLRLLGKPMVFFFSPRTFCRILGEAGLDVERVQAIDWGRMTQFSQALFPWFKFPLRRTPVKCILITAAKV